MSEAKPGGSRPSRFVRSRRAAVVWTLVVVALAQLGVGTALRSWAPELTDEELGGRFRGLEARLAAQPRSLVVLALGSSRIQCGFMPARVEAPLAQATGRAVVAYNLGVQRGLATTEEIVLRRLLAARIRPDLVVLEGVAISLFEPETRDGALAPERLSFSELALADERFPASASASLWRDWALAHSVPVFRDRIALQGRFLGATWTAPTIPSDPAMLGWQPLPPDPPTSGRVNYALKRSRTEYRPIVSQPTAVREAPRQALEAVLALLARERIPAVLVETPERTELRNWYAPENRAAADRALESLAREAGATYVGASEWVLRDDGFWDSLHLDPSGAALFTDRLEREALRPRLATGGR